VSRRARIIAFYLPQFHPIPENDEWWGSGFTEWRNVARARPMFRGHSQPRIPADLGFYDLRVPEVRQAQADLASAHGIEAFCYWHYWFAGKRLLERPFTEVVRSKEPDFPFCLGWANESWTGVWHGLPNKMLIEQTYPGVADLIAHFHALLPAFGDPRHVLVDGKPLFYVYRPTFLPDARHFTDLWRELAHKAGLRGLYLVGEGRPSWDPRAAGFDASIDTSLIGRIVACSWLEPRRRLQWEWKTLMHRPTIYSYAKVCERFVWDRVGSRPHVTSHVPLLPDWDNTPRSGVNALVLRDSTPELFRKQVRVALSFGGDELLDHRLVFLKSWNEWAEGNYVEPDVRFGRGYLEVLKEEVGV